jgi:hypothetical protein
LCQRCRFQIHAGYYSTRISRGNPRGCSPRKIDLSKTVN